MNCRIISAQLQRRLKPMSERRTIYCCACRNDVSARLTDGSEVYPHRNDLSSLPFWKCDNCSNFVGCHHKTKNRTNPLGIIATKEIKSARQHIHSVLDPIWKNKRMKRGDLYRRIAAIMGIDEYHTAKLRSIEDARSAYRAVIQIRKEMGLEHS